MEPHENIENNVKTMKRPVPAPLVGKNWQPGQSGNPGGRPRNPLKDFSLQEFKSWDEEKKRAFLEKVSPIDRWKMTEGNPQTDTDITSGGQPIVLLTDEQRKKLDLLLE